MTRLGDLFAGVWAALGTRPYDALYRRGAPWEGEPRAELVDLLGSARLAPEQLTGRRALDVGCGTGDDSRVLADHGFDVTGVDFSPVALAKARQAADGRADMRFVEADLFALPGAVTAEPYDLILDSGTVDDFPPGKRRELAGVLTRLAHPGTVLVMWCFSAPPQTAPWISFSGPSRVFGLGIQPDEVASLFARHWDIEALPAEPGAMSSTYWMTRNDVSA